jgi:hypothetical protein
MIIAGNKFSSFSFTLMQDPGRAEKTTTKELRKVVGLLVK